MQPTRTKNNTIKQGCSGGKFIGTEVRVGVFKFDLSEAELESEAESEVVTREIFFI